MKDPAEEAVDTNKRILLVLTIVSFFVLTWALKWAYPVIMPLAFSLFITVVVQPVRRKLAEHLPRRLRWLSVVAAMGTVILVLLVLITLIWLVIYDVSGSISKYSEELQQFLSSAIGWLQNRGVPISRSIFGTRDFRNQALSIITGGVSTGWEVVAFLILVLFLSLLMLLEVAESREKSRDAFGETHAESLKDTLETMAEKLRKFLLVRTFVSLLSGVVAGLWLWILGVDFALAWAILTFVLNYIPNVGSVLSTLLPSLLALVQFDWAKALITVSGLTAMEQIIGYVLDPKLQGRTLSVSPAVVLISILFWGFVWGGVGVVLAVPLTITLIIAFSHVPSLEPLAQMLSRDTSGVE